MDAYRDKKVVSVFVQFFSAPLPSDWLNLGCMNHDAKWETEAFHHVKKVQLQLWRQTLLRSEQNLLNLSTTVIITGTVLWR
jgi:hypothetical protein